MQYIRKMYLLTHHLNLPFIYILLWIQSYTHIRGVYLESRVGNVYIFFRICIFPTRHRGCAYLHSIFTSCHYMWLLIGYDILMFWLGGGVCWFVSPFFQISCFPLYSYLWPPLPQTISLPWFCPPIFILIVALQYVLASFLIILANIQTFSHPPFPFDHL